MTAAVPQPPGASAATYDPRWFDLLERVEDRHFWFTARWRVIAALARQAMRDAPANSRVLEIGCGNGGLLATLQSACPTARVIGTDLYLDALRHARGRSSAALVQCDVRRPPFDVPFHLIGMFDVLEHLPDDVSVLRDVRRMLAPGRALLLTVPAHMWLWSYFDVASNHQRRYSPRALRQALVAAGFTVEYLSQFMAPLVPIMWASRRASAKKQRDAADEMKIVTGVNAIMNAAMAMEAALIRRRVRMPLGTSLVALVRRGAA